MSNLFSMLWVELRKAIRSRMPLWTALGALFMPLGIAFLIFVARNPEISKKLGLVGAKANLVSYASTDWPAYLSLFGQVMAAGGFILFMLATSWVFGREFADGTLKDLLAVPVERGAIVLAKFIAAALWSGMMTLVIFTAGLATGAAMQMPGGSVQVLLSGSFRLVVAAGLALVVVTPFAFFASAGRGYLLPIGLAMAAAMSMNMAVLLGWGDYFPWAVPSLYAQGKSVLGMVSYAVVFLTGLVGMLATYAWWKYADQSR
jgi:ABC-2 type transport system permease protein